MRDRSVFVRPSTRPLLALTSLFVPAILFMVFAGHIVEALTNLIGNGAFGVILMTYSGMLLAFVLLLGGNKKKAW